MNTPSQGVPMHGRSGITESREDWRTKLPAGVRPNALVIDLEAIEHNARTLRGAVGQSVRIVAALKADGHGHGLGAVATAARDGGIDGVAVVDVCEALALRRDLGPEIILLAYAGSYVTPEVVSQCEQSGVILSIVDEQGARQCAQWASGKLEVYVKVDVGLERLGVYAEQAPALVRLARRLTGFEVGGIYTHMHVRETDEPDSPYTAWQFDRFNRAIEQVEADGGPLKIKMAAASPVLLRTFGMNLTAIDPGRLMYGVRPLGPDVTALDLKPAVQGLKSCLVQVKDVLHREYLDHAQVPVEPGMRIGVIPIGQIDGMPYIGSGSVLVRGTRVPVLGEPSLEHTRVALSDVPDARPGDEVVIVGRQGGKEVTLADVEDYHGVKLSDGLPLIVGSHVQRIYV